MAADIATQLGTAAAESSDCIVGVMLESNLKEGNQKLSPGVTDPKTLVYGLSVVSHVTSSASRISNSCHIEHGRGSN